MSSPENSLSDDGKDDLETSPRQTSEAELPSAAGQVHSSIFKDSILTQFEEAGRQVGAGVYWMKRVGHLLKKFSALEAQFARDLLKLVDHEIEKAETTGTVPSRAIYKDHMPRAWNAIQQFHGAMRDIAQYHMDHSKTVKSCAKPITHFFKNTHQKLNKNVTKLDASSKAIAVGREKVLKQKMKVLGSYDAGGKGMAGGRARILRSALSSSSDSAPKDGPSAQPSLQMTGKFGKMLGNIMGVGGASPTAPLTGSTSNVFAAVTPPEKKEEPRSRVDSTVDDKTMNMAKEYMKVVDQVNQSQDKFLNEELSEAHFFFENTEKARVEILQGQLNMFVGSYGQLKTNFDDTLERLNRQLTMISTQADIYNFVNFVERTAPAKTASYAKLDYDLPFIKEKTTATNVTDSGPDLGIFGLTLHELIKVEREDNPNAKVPTIFTILLDATKNLGGFKTEGIFRISAAKQALDELRAQIISGNYKIETKDPHLTAGLLKEWLRGLPEPLFAHSIYDECIKIAKDDCHDPAVYLGVMGKLHEVNRHVINGMLDLITEMTKPAIVEVTKMNLRNLAVVFAPSFLRYKGNDPMMILKNNVLELQFVMNLVGLYNPETFAAAAVAKKHKKKHERTQSQDLLQKFDQLVASESADALMPLDSKENLTTEDDNTKGNTRESLSTLPTLNTEADAGRSSVTSKNESIPSIETVSSSIAPAPLMDFRLSSEFSPAEISSSSEPTSPAT